jgi:calpain-7
MVNPQYHLRINPPKHANSSTQKANVSLTMQMGRDVPVNIALAWSQGSRIFEYVVSSGESITTRHCMPDFFRLAQKDLAASSGAYGYGLARLTKSLQGTRSFSGTHGL